MIRDAVRPLLSFAAICVLAGCATTVKQDKATGPDGRSKGALKIKLDDEGEGTAKGVVTYPGGDRVDWKVFELDKLSDVEVTLKWLPPRPNLDLSMNVLDDTYHIVKRLAPADGSRTRKTAELSRLQPGKYYVQVYASGRGDAGEYEVEVRATPSRAPTPIVSGDPIPNPPRLPAVPGAVVPPGGAAASNNIPAGQPGSKENPCQMGQACPAGALFLNPQCLEAGGLPQGAPCPPKAAINPACPEAGPLFPDQPCPAKARAGRIIERSIAGKDIEITVDKGTNQGIAKGWTGTVFEGRSGTKMLRGGVFTIFKVTEDESYGKIRNMSLDQLGDHYRVELKSPPQ